jgi:SAM-dependent methyltransferase
VEFSHYDHSDNDYSNNDYGEQFADVYDEWYEDLDDIDGVVRFVVDLADSQPVLELGVGTGRLAVPLSQHVPVTGVDNSPSMMARLLARPDVDPRLTVSVGHMVRDMPRGPFAVVLIAYNTLFNLLSGDEQRACLAEANERLMVGGHVIIDAFVPDDEITNSAEQGTQVVRGDRLVESRSWVDTTRQLMGGTFIDESGRGRDWQVRYASPAEIDEMARAAGLVLESRFSSYSREPFTDASSRHISVYGRAPECTA